VVTPLSRFKGRQPQQHEFTVTLNSFDPSSGQVLLQRHGVIDEICLPSVTDMIRRPRIACPILALTVSTSGSSGKRFSGGGSYPSRSEEPDFIDDPWRWSSTARRRIEAV